MEAKLVRIDGQLLVLTNNVFEYECRVKEAHKQCLFISKEQMTYLSNGKPIIIGIRMRENDGETMFLDIENVQNEEGKPFGFSEVIDLSYYTCTRDGTDLTDKEVEEIAGAADAVFKHLAKATGALYLITENGPNAGRADYFSDSMVNCKKETMHRFFDLLEEIARQAYEEREE